MKSFDEHFKGAKNHNQEDLKWLLACYYGTMMNLCNEYSYFGDEDLFGLIARFRLWVSNDSYKCCRGCCVTCPYYKDCEADAQKR